MIKLTIHLERPAHRAKEVVKAVGEALSKLEPFKEVIQSAMANRHNQRLASMIRAGSGRHAGLDSHQECPSYDDYDTCRECPDYAGCGERDERDDDVRRSDDGLSMDGHSFGTWTRDENGTLTIEATNEDGVVVLVLTIPDTKVQGGVVALLQYVMGYMGVVIPRVDVGEDSEPEIH